MVDDVFLHRLITMVCDFYDEWYSPQEAYHKHQPMTNASLKAVKENHIRILLKNYDKKDLKIVKIYMKKELNF